MSVSTPLSESPRTAARRARPPPAIGRSPGWCRRRRSSRRRRRARARSIATASACACPGSVRSTIMWPTTSWCRSSSATASASTISVSPLFPMAAVAARAVGPVGGPLDELRARGCRATASPAWRRCHAPQPRPELFLAGDRLPLNQVPDDRLPMDFMSVYSAVAAETSVFIHHMHIAMQYCPAKLLTCSRQCLYNYSFG